MNNALEADATFLARMPGAEAEFARRVRRGATRSFTAFASNNRSRTARGVLMRAASDGAFGLAELDAMLQAVGRGSSRDLAVDLLRSMDPKPLLALAGLVGNQRLTPTDVDHALTLYALLAEAFGPKAFGRQDRLLYLELLSECGRHDDFEATFSSMPLGNDDWRQAMLMAANLANPWVEGNERGDVGLWTRITRTIFNADGMEPIEVAPTVAPAFDNILCSSLAAVEKGPKITVLVPTHNPGPRLGTALASLLNQTWQNLEILILDDGSERVHRWYMSAWVERDPRVRVLHMPTNIGNYAARNIGIREAKGDFVTVHDDDDWSHPRKLELQARSLVADPGILANMSQLARATDSLRFTRINGNPSFIQPNYSSLMFRREPVLESIGYWNEVNRAADAEFRNRLTAWSGVAPATVGNAPMSFLRVREGSLTSGEIQRGYFDARRRWYELSSSGWHRDAVAAGGSLHLPLGETHDRFSVPTSMLGSRTEDRTEVDIVYATDFRFPGGNTSVSVNEIQTLLDNGYRVALLQLDSPVLGSTTELTERIRRLSLHPACSVVSLRDGVDTDVLVVRHPTVMQFVEPVRSAISARSAVLIVNHAPAMRDGTASHYDIRECVRNFRAVFGQDPQVAPESGVIRDCLRGEIPESVMTSFDWNGMLSVEGCAPRTTDPGRSPVIGRHSRDNVEKWPSRIEDLTAAYPIDGSRDVRFLGGADAALSQLGDRAVEGWTVHPFGSVAPQEFLAGLDFWVYFHSEHLVESFGMATAEAMAAGAVVILPHYMESTFGPGAVYCKAEEVQAVVDEFWANDLAYAEQSRQGIDIATTRFTVERFLERITSLSEA